MRSFELDLLQTLSLAVAVHFAGVKLRQWIGVLDRMNIPSAVVGGLLFAAIVLGLHVGGVTVRLDTAAQSVLNVTFFTTIGTGASLALLRRGGRDVAVCLLFAIGICLVQNAIGIGVALAFGESPLLGVMAGSVTLVGGPATGLAFAPLFEEHGLMGADVIAITSAVFGIVCGGVAGNPVGTALIRRHRLASGERGAPPIDERAASGGSDEVLAPASPSDARAFSVDLQREDTAIVRHVAILAIAMGLGSVVSWSIQRAGLTLPPYIGAMLVAAGLRNLDEATGWLAIDERIMEFLGGVALNVFLVVALMDLRLWEVESEAVVLFAILVVQLVALVALAQGVAFRLMGRDYDAAVMASGFIGFAMGTTANAVANMRALTTRFGPAPRAFLVIPLVGALFIDFANALIVTAVVNGIV